MKATMGKAPMGWNSYDYYDTTVTEEQVKANADYMAAHLKDCGWEYVVVAFPPGAAGQGRSCPEEGRAPSDAPKGTHGWLIW